MAANEPLNQSSFDRNFDMDSDNVQSTIGKSIMIDNDEFSFIQLRSPNSSREMDSREMDKEMNSRDLEHFEQLGDEEPKEGIKGVKKPSPVLSSPSKSALKKPQNFASPKKNVVFESAIPEVIHYTEHDSSVDEAQKLEDDKFSDKIEQTLSHNWNQVRQSSLSSDDTTPPPVPPPHAVEFESPKKSLQQQDQEPKDLDRTALHQFKLHTKNLDNLSLNEKLDIFLNNQSHEPKTKDMDQHLQDLEAKSNYDLQNNIHHLSLDLQNKLGQRIEDPLNSLSRSTEVPLRSAGSSQSSLQSLMDNNRLLQSDVVDQTSKGIQLNDGIHGFSNDLVEQLIPPADETLVTTNLEMPGQFDASDESQMLSMGRSASRGTMDPMGSNRHSVASFVSNNDEEFHDSFDNDYNNTEQSIMNLLSSAVSKSQENLEPQNLEQPGHSEETQSKEINFISVKEEPQDFVSIKKSPSTEDVIFKQENDISESKIIPEPERPVLKSPDSDVSFTDEKGTDGSETDSPERQFRISDHIDQGWKFEDSLDADREDNDEFTNGDITMVSQHPADGLTEDILEEKPQNFQHLDLKNESMDSSDSQFVSKDLDVQFIGKESDDGFVPEASKQSEEPKSIPKGSTESFGAKENLNSALEINLSPDTSLSIEESPDRVSLAPPRSIHSLQNSPVRSLIKAEAASSPEEQVERTLAPKMAPLEPLEMKLAASVSSEEPDEKKLTPVSSKEQVKTLSPSKPIEKTLAPPSPSKTAFTPSEQASALSGPATLSSLESESIPRSKAAKTVDVAVDATVPPTPIRIARENKLKQKYGSVSPSIKSSEVSPFVSKVSSFGEVTPFVKSEPSPFVTDGFNDKIERSPVKEAVNVPLPVVEPHPVAEIQQESEVEEESEQVIGQNVLNTEVPIQKELDVSEVPIQKELVSEVPVQQEQDTTLVSTQKTPKDALEVALDGSDVSRSVPESDVTGPELEAEVLANSTNVAPPEEITLPPIEPNNYSSFEDFTKTLNNSKDIEQDSFEQSLSAEFDEEKPSKATSYLSIWHSQNKSSKPKLHTAQKSIDANNISIYDPASNTFKIPAGLLNKRIKEVNVMSRKVVDPNEVDYEVKDFLPELSQDSGFESHFNNLVNTSQNDSFSTGNRLSITPLSERNILTNMKNESNESIEGQVQGQVQKHGQGQKQGQVPVPVAPIKNVAVPERSQAYPKTLQPVPPQPIEPQEAQVQRLGQQTTRPITQISQKRSKFRVPSIDIERSMAAASGAGTRDKYNDIFNDTGEIQPNEPPTIKGHGMKTLPSMDKDDVRKIMNTKRIISQEEYSQLKLVGQKSAVVNDNDANMYDYLQQQASLHHADTSFESNNNVLPHIAGELMKNPKALLSKEQVFNDSDILSSKAPSSPKSRVSSIIHTDYNPNQTFPEPDPELINSPAGGIFKTPPKDHGYGNEEVMILEGEGDKENKPPGVNSGSKQSEQPPVFKAIKKEIEAPSVSVSSEKRSPIKIGSPIKMIKKGSTTSVVIDSPKKGKLDPSKTKLDPSKAKLITGDSSRDTSVGSSVRYQFSGAELSNNKLRQKEPSSKLKQREPSAVHEKKLSVVSVPSLYTNFTEPSHDSSYTLLNKQQFQQGPGSRNVSPNETDAWKQHSIQSSVVREASEPLAMERGRLFFRVIGFKDIRLPDIEKNQGEFSVTLDNGVHCIKTPNYKVEESSVLIGKEFELTVGDSLEFILTMKMTYEKPKGSYVEVRERKVVKSKSRLSRMFGSKDVVTTTKFVPQDAVDTWKGKFAQDGSFGRCYVDLEQYENKITYSPNSFDIPVFNEWEASNANPQENLKPYVIGKLEVKMLFIPRTETHEALPTSIKSCNEVINQILQEKNIEYEGYLTQDGGDCESLKRRYFKLKGTSLIAHSEFNHKTRAKINLAKVTDVIYVDHERPETSKKARNFSDVLLVPESFKIKFANGEIIDFGAPNINEKYRWINSFETIAQHNRFRRLPWVKSMLEEVGSKTNNPWYNADTNEYK